MSEVREQVVHATVRESIDEEWLDIECRFANGEKFVAVQVVTDRPELAQRIAALLATPASDGGEVRERAWTLARELAEVFASATGGNYEPDTLMHRAGSWAAEEIERALLSGTPQTDDAPPTATLYRRRCGWCGAYEGTADPKEPCATDETGYIGPHQFEVLEAVRGTPQVEGEEEARLWHLAGVADAYCWGQASRADLSAAVDRLHERNPERLPPETTTAAPTGEGEAKGRAIPSWACERWGSYMHDWLDCPKCIAGYESAAPSGVEEGEGRDAVVAVYEETGEVVSITFPEWWGPKRPDPDEFARRYPNTVGRRARLVIEPAAPVPARKEEDDRLREVLYRWWRADKTQDGSFMRHDQELADLAEELFAARLRGEGGGE